MIYLTQFLWRCRWGAIGPLIMLLMTSPVVQAKEGVSVISANSQIVQQLVGLSQTRTRRCADTDKTRIPPTWRSTKSVCAWQGRLHIRRWTAQAQPDAATCLSSAAQWWAWLRGRFAHGTQTDPAVWHDSWQLRSLSSRTGGRLRVALIEHLAQGAWQATEWTWTPGRRASSHSWEARRITLLMQQIAAMEATQPIDTSTSDSVDVTSAWQAILRGRAGEIAAGIYSWQSDGMCLHMKRSTADELPFPLPYARDDARLEQRVAFQIRLTQRYPQASWLTLFRLLPAPPKMPYRSSKYEAIWNEQATVIGQLWIKRKNQRNPVCVRVDVALPLKKGGPKGDAVNMPIALVIDRELTALAHAWAN